MKVLFMLGAIAAAAAPGTALAAGKPISCLYDHVAHNDKIDRDDLRALVAGNMVAASNGQKIAMARIGSELGKCQTQYGWSRNRQHAVFAYLHARLLYDSQRDALDAHGITFEMIERVVDAMPPALRKTYLGGAVTRPMAEDAIAKLQAAGASVDATAGDQAFDVAVAKALVAAIAEDDAEQSFAAR